MLMLTSSFTSRQLGLKNLHLYRTTDKALITWHEIYQWNRKRRRRAWGVQRVRRRHRPPTAGRRRIGHDRPRWNFSESMATPCHTPMIGDDSYWLVKLCKRRYFRRPVFTPIRHRGTSLQQIQRWKRSKPDVRSVRWRLLKEGNGGK
jgi:hypothetical protein